MVSFFDYRIGFGTVDNQLANCHDKDGGTDGHSSSLFLIKMTLTSAA